MSALPLKADMCGATRDVRFGPIADMAALFDPSSAALRSPSGTVRASALAVLRLITNSNWVGCCTGRSAGAPHNGLATLIERTKWRISADMAGRPGRRLDFQRQYDWKPARCQRRTVFRPDDGERVASMRKQPAEPTKNQSVSDQEWQSR